MIGIDTNVLVRLLVVDDPQLNAQAKAFLAKPMPGMELLA